MAGPWEKYKTTDTKTTGPWAKYKSNSAPAVSQPVDAEPSPETMSQTPNVLPEGQNLDPNPEFDYLKPVTGVPDFTPEEIEQANAPMVDLAGSPIKPAFGDDPNPEPIGMTTHTEMEPAKGDINQILADSLDEKGDISTAVYDGLTFPVAMQVYEKLLNHPDSKLVRPNVGELNDAMGLDEGNVSDYLVFRGHKVPMPEPSMFGEQTVGASPGARTIIGEGLVDNASNFAQWALSGVDTALGTNMSPSMERPEMKMGGMTDSLLHEAPSAVIGGLVGLKGADKLVTGAGKLIAPTLSKTAPIVQATGNLVGKTVGAGTRMLGAEGGSTAGLDEDASGIFAGPDAPLRTDDKTYNGPFVDIDEVDTPGEKTFWKKWNLMLDSGLTGSAVGGVGRAVTATGGFFKNVYIDALMPAASERARSKIINDEIMQRLGQLPPGASNNDRAKVAGYLSEVMDEGQSTFKALKDSSTREVVELDPLAAIIAGAKERAKLGGADGERAKSLIVDAENMRNDILQARMDKTTAKQTSYENEVINPMKQEIVDQGGGAAGVEASREAVIRSGQEEMGESLAQREAARQDFDTATENYADRIRTDINFGAEISALEKQTGLIVDQGSRQSSREVGDQLFKAEAKMSAERERLYNKIPRTVKVERGGDDGFDQFVYETVKDKKGNDVVQFRKDIPKELQTIITQADGSFKDIHNDLVPRLTKLIAANRDPTGVLADLKDNIIDYQIDNLRVLGGAGRSVAADAIDKARNYNMEYMRFFGKGSTLADVSGAVRGKRKLQAANAGNLSEAERKVRIAARDNILSGDDNLERGVDAVNVLNRADVAGDPSTIVKDFVNEATSNLRSKIQNEGITSLDREDFVQAIRNRSALIAEKFPQQAAELDKLGDDLVAGRTTINDLDAKYTTAATETSEDLNRVQTEQADFLKPDGNGGFKPKTEGQEIFQNIFEKNADLEPLDNAIKRADATGDGGGIRAAFGERLKNVSLEDYRKSSRVKDVAKKLFQKTPEVVDAIDEAYRLDELTQLGKGTRASAKTLGAETDQEYKANINKIVTLFFGVLNPTATRVRNLTGVMAENTKPSLALQKTLDLVTSNPEQFQKMMTNFNKKDFFDQRNKRLVIEFMSRASLRSGPLTDKSREYINQEWETARMNEGMSGEDTTDQQTEDMLK